MSRVNWLVSSAGRRGHLVRLIQEVCQLNGEGRVVAVDASPLSAAGLLADAFEVVPPVHDDRFIGAILELCDRHNVRYVVPTIDTELPKYALARTEFQSLGTQVWVSAPSVVQLSQDKLRFNEWLLSHGLHAPRMVSAPDISSAGFSGAVIAKPRVGSSSIGLLRAERWESLDSAGLDDTYVIQIAANGYEVTSDFAVDIFGRIVGISHRRRLEVRAGEVSKAVTISHTGLTRQLSRMIHLLPGSFGVLNVQSFVDSASGLVSIIELNARFGGGYPLSWQAGAKFPLALTRSSAGEFRRLDGDPGIVMLRYDAAVYGRAGHYSDLMSVLGDTV